MTSFEDLVKQLSNPAPVDEDPEDDTGDLTAARLASHTHAEEESFLSQQSSLLRRRAATYLETDPRYQGKKAARKDLYELTNDEIDEELDESDLNSASDSVDDDEHSNQLQEDNEEKYEEEIDSGDEEEPDEKEDLASEDDANDEEITSSSDSEEPAIHDEEKDEGEKSRAVVEQLDLWDRLMEIRIKLQKILSLINKIPAEVEGSAMQEKAQSVLKELSCSLCGLQPVRSSARKRAAEEDTEQLAKENFLAYQSLRNDTLTFWDDKTRLVSKKFKSFNSFNTSVLKQVEQILSDQDRLVRRTRVSRDAEAVENKPEEIFDDNDFYQRLLRQLVENKAEDASTLASTQNQWLEIQKLRVKKKKKEVDTRASKGRKLRYNVHSKLVNFMAPRDDSTWSEDAKNELFKNLFKMPTSVEQ